MEVEQKHIQDALVFELGKVVSPTIRSRMLSHLLNVDKKLAINIAEQLELIPSRAAKILSPFKKLEKSPSLSILANSLNTFKGHTLGVLVTENIDIALIHGFKKAAQEEGAMLEIIAPKIGGVRIKNGMKIEVQHTIDNGSVFFDAIALLLDEQIDEKLTEPLCTFIRDAFTHAKFIAYNQKALSFFKKIRLDPHLDDGFSTVKTTHDCKRKRQLLF